jgi:hypothetical protein
MNTGTRDFLRELYSRCDPSCYLTLTAIHPDGEHPTPSRHIRLGNAEQTGNALADLVSANNLGWGAYFGVAPRLSDMGRWHRGKKSELACLPALFVDIDRAECGMDDLSALVHKPSAIIYSGHGLHAYWYLNRPTLDITNAEHILTRLAIRLGGDTHISTAGSMRLPGTLNTKRQPYVPCRLLHHEPQRRYDLADFAFLIPPGRSGPNSTSIPRSPTRMNKYRAVRDAVTDFVLTALDGFYKSNGWIAARCPCTHHQDKPGKHFNYHAVSGVGYCFGKHGKLDFGEMCELAGLTAPLHT